LQEGAYLFIEKQFKKKCLYEGGGAGWYNVDTINRNKQVPFSEI